MGLFDDDFDAVDDMMADVFFSTVTIQRKASLTTGVIAEAVSRDYEVTDEQGFITTTHVRDYVIDVSAYLVGGSTVAPRAGDLIKETIDSTVHTFEVTPLPSRPCAEWSTTQKPQWVIHTNMIGTS